MSMQVGDRRVNSGRRVVVIGAGAWGTTLAMLADRAGHRVALVAHRPELAATLRATRQHPNSLPGIILPDSIAVLSEIDPEMAESNAAVLAIPVQKLRTALHDIEGTIEKVPVISVAKGIEIDTLLRPTEIISEVLGEDHPVAALSGPNLAMEIAEGLPATTVLASRYEGLAADLVGLFHSPRFRVYRGDDVIGLEIGGALKNIIAIGAGIGEGLGAGDNAKAAFITRGLSEITRIGVACGAQAMTLAGISGMGDLIATCASPHSRNHRVGLALARGASLDEATKLVGEVAEGIPTTLAAHQLAFRSNVDAPIIEQMYRVLFQGSPVTEAINLLMAREPTDEVRAM